VVNKGHLSGGKAQGEVENKSLLIWGRGSGGEVVSKGPLGGGKVSGRESGEQGSFEWGEGERIGTIIDSDIR